MRIIENILKLKEYKNLSLNLVHSNEKIVNITQYNIKMNWLNTRTFQSNKVKHKANNEVLKIREPSRTTVLTFSS